MKVFLFESSVYNDCCPSTQNDFLARDLYCFFLITWYNNSLVLISWRRLLFSIKLRQQIFFGPKSANLHCNEAGQLSRHCWLQRKSDVCSTVSFPAHLLLIMNVCTLGCTHLRVSCNEKQNQEKPDWFWVSLQNSNSDPFCLKVC